MEVTASMLDELAPGARSAFLAPGDVLVEQGDVADDVYFVRSGSLEALNATPFGPVTVGVVGPGQVVGEVTVIAGGRRTATLRAIEPTDVVVVDRPEFERWLTAKPEAADAVSAQARERIDRAHVASMVTDLLGTADASLVQDIVDRVRWRRLEAGEVLFEQGDASDAAYFIVGGRVMVLVRAENGDLSPVSELGRGEVVGELGLLDDAPRSATVRAVRDTTLAVFPTATFEELVTRSPALMLHVARGILTRLKRTPRRLVGRATSIAVVVTAPVDRSDFIDGIVDEIGRFGTVKHLSSDRVDRLLNRPGIAQAESDNVGVPRLAEFMHEADVGNDYMVMEADPDHTMWTRRALRQADRIVIVSSPHPRGDEAAAIRATVDTVADVGHITTMLAFVHPAGARPRGTASLIDAFGVDEVVHLRADVASDIGRLGRLASGNGVGLVLSGGGARGFAHLGVYRALLESGVPIDHVGGCSMGAPLAAAIALGHVGDELEEGVQRQFHRLLDYTLPVVSMVKGRRISASIDAVLGDWDIEDLWLSYYCVSTNLTLARLEIHRRGSAARAVRASVAIPGILPPVPFDGDLLVDGGVLNNLPFQPMRNDGRIDTVIAVDVASPRGPSAKSDFGTSVSGMRALAAIAGRRHNPYPNVAAVLLRSMLTGSVRNQRESMSDEAVDLMVPLALPGVGLLDFERTREVAAIGYDASVDTIATWASSVPWLVRT